MVGAEVYVVGSMLTSDVARPEARFDSLKAALDWCVEHPEEQRRFGASAVRPWVARSTVGESGSSSVIGFVVIGGRTQRQWRRTSAQPRAEEISLCEAWEILRKGSQGGLTGAMDGVKAGEAVGQ